MRALLAGVGVVVMGCLVVHRELETRERQKRWHEIEHNAQLMQRATSADTMSVQQEIELEPAPNGVIMLAHAYVVVHAGDHTSREAVPASPIGYGEELTGCSTTPDGTLVLIGNEFRPHAEKLAVVWKRTAAGTWSSAVPASEAHPVASAGTTCTLGGVSYELVSEITTAPYESVRARREQYARDLDTQTLQRML